MQDYKNFYFRIQGELFNNPAAVSDKANTRVKELEEILNNLKMEENTPPVADSHNIKETAAQDSIETSAQTIVAAPVEFTPAETIVAAPVEFAPAQTIVAAPVEFTPAETKFAAPVETSDPVENVVTVVDAPVETLITKEPNVEVLKEDFVDTARVFQEENLKSIEIKATEVLEDKAKILLTDTMETISTKPRSSQDKEKAVKNSENIVVSSKGNFSMRITQAEPDISDHNEGCYIYIKKIKIF